MALSAACAAGAGLFACVGDSPTTTPDAAVIDAAPDGACPTATSCDPKNCGKVGHDCLGGACVAGACRPVEIATGQIHPTVIRVDGDTLYWIDIGTLTNGSCSATTDGSVMRAKVDGSQLTAIATGQKCPSDLVLAGTDLYWTVQGNGNFADGAVMHAPKNGTGATPLYSNIVQAARLATDGTTLYVSAANNGALDDIFRAPLSGSGPLVKMAAQQVNVSGIEVQGSRILWGTVGPGSLRTAATTYALDAGADASGAPTLLNGDAGYPITFTQTSGNVIYLADRDQGQVKKIEVGSLDPSAVATGQGTPYGVAVDGSYVYWWSSSAGILWRGQLDGVGTPLNVASHPQGGFAYLAIDATAVYVSNIDSGKILRIAKP